MNNKSSKSVRENLLSLAREHVVRQMRAGFSVVPDFDSLRFVVLDDGSVAASFDSFVGCKPVVSRVSLSPAEAAGCSDWDSLAPIKIPRYLPSRHPLRLALQAKLNNR